MPSAAAGDRMARVASFGTTFGSKWYYVVTTQLRAGSLSGINTEFM
jgi:hypothetical protein